MKAHHKLVEEAISSLIFTHPFYASVLLQLEVVSDSSCKTFWTDGKKVGYNPTYVDSLDFDLTKGILAHEVCHVVLLHFARMSGRDVETWNKATDYVINWQLKESGFKLPNNVLLDSRFANTNAEDAYRVLMQEKQEEEQQNNQSNEDNEDSSNSQSSGKSDENEESDDDNDADSDSDEESDSEEEDDSPSNGTSGSDNNGSSESQDEESFDGNIGEVRQSTDADPQELEERAVMMAKFAENMAKACGNMPAGMQRLVEQARKPIHDWREVLNRFLTQQAAKDYSFLHANRRHLSRGVILPSLKNKTIGKVVVACDTSGSVSDEEIKKLLAEISHMLDIINESAEQAEITIIYCDSDVAGVDVYDGTTNFNPKGGGGTRYGPVFRYIQDNDLQPDCVIYLTDGYCYDYGTILPDYPVLWAITVSYGDFIPPFGEVMKLHNFLG